METTNETTVAPRARFSDLIARLDADVRDHGTMGPEELGRCQASLVSLASALGLRALPVSLAAKSNRQTVEGFDSGVIYVGLCQEVADKLANDEDVDTELNDLRAALRAEGFGQRDYDVQVVHHVQVITYRRVTAPDEDTAADLAYDELANPAFTVDGPDCDDWEVLDTEVALVDAAE